MFKSIFSKIMWANIAIIILSFALTATLTYNLLGNYAVNQKAEVLLAVAPRISSATVSLQVDNRGGVYDRVYADNLEVFSNITGSSIFIVNHLGEPYKQMSTLGGDVAIPQNYIDSALKGNIVQEIGHIKGLNDPVLTVGYPIENRGENIGGVFLVSTMPYLDFNRVSSFRLFVVIGGVVFPFAFIIMYFLSKRMTNPLKRMTRAAKSIASGNLKERVYVDTSDEIGQLATTFNYMADSLVKQDDIQSSFIANVSHELRTPMTTISGFVENILNGTIPPERQNEYLQITLDETKRLARLVSDMLDISKISAGQFSLDIKPFDIAEMIRLTVIKFETAIDEKHLDLSIDFEHESIAVLADKDAVSRVITNLMDNAIKFSDPSSQINIKVFTKSKKACIAIQNEGMGIEPEDIESVWDRFFKSDKSRNEHKKGAGLGLYMVKNLLHMHGENIVVRSVDILDSEYGGNPNHPARRTTFMFTLGLA